MSQISLRCINCNCDDVQKVSSIYKCGTSTNTTGTRGLAISLDDLSPVVFGSKAKGTNQTHLAQQLSPPVYTPASKPEALLLLVLGVMGGFGALGIWMGLLFSSSKSFIPMMLSAIVLPILTGFLFKYAFKLSNENINQNAVRHKVYESELSNWNLRYYCHRCDSVFIPAS